MIFLGGTTPAHAETLKADSKISEVTVFQDRALVTRTAELKLAPGEHAVEFDGLPGTLEEGSVSVRGKGTAAVVLFGARPATVQSKELQSPKAQEIEAQIKKLEEQKQTLQFRKDALEKKADFLGSVKAATADQIGKDIMTKQPSVQDIAAIADYMETGFSDVFVKMQQIETEMRKLDEDLDRLRRELYELNNFSNRAKKTVWIDLEAKTAGSFTLELSYRVGGASWEPLYEARTKSEGAEVDFSVFAMVRQQTGENWDNVRLSLSTARPAVYGRIPESDPWYLSVFQPVVMRREMKMKADLSYDKSQEYASTAAAGAMMMAAPEPVAEAQMATADVSNQGPSVRYLLPKLDSIAADWQPKKLAVASQVFPATFSYKVVPRLSDSAFLTAKVRNQSQGLLLAGPVQVFLDDAYVGSSSIDTWGMNEEIALSLGTDDRLRLERKQLKAKEDLSVLPGLHGKTKTIDYVYWTKIENFGSREADVTLEDQVPVSQHDEIKVEQIVYEPKPTEADSEKPGVQRWTFKMTPKEKKEFKISFRVKYPVEFRVTGL
ncbi:MAG: mucoidy inhibitor MuiA family protein [Candidatus Omnitrophota bacterium]|jgi:uncharacterized protein (TIGR02231 family)